MNSGLKSNITDVREQCQQQHDSRQVSMGLCGAKRQEKQCDLPNKDFIMTDKEIKDLHEARKLKEATSSGAKEDADDSSEEAEPKAEAKAKAKADAKNDSDDCDQIEWRFAGRHRVRKLIAGWHKLAAGHRHLHLSM